MTDACLGLEDNPSLMGRLGVPEENQREEIQPPPRAELGGVRWASSRVASVVMGRTGGMAAIHEGGERSPSWRC